MLDDKEALNALIVLNNIARVALVNGDNGDARNAAANTLKAALDERIDLRSQYGECLEEVDKLKNQNSV